MNSDSESQTAIFLVENHPVMRFGLKTMLERHDYAICGEAATADEATSLLPTANAKIAIFDLSLNEGTAFAGLNEVRKLLPELLLIVYSMQDAQLFVENALKIGVNGYVTKSDPVETLIDAIEEVMAGNRFFGPALAKTMEKRLVLQTGIEIALQDLPSREMEILTLLGQGFSRSEIAKQLRLSTRTVETYLERLKQRFGVSNNRELTRKAISIIHQK
ncbi:MAG: response regulator transcription factor [Candidatus Riflebacteria bacterium]|nr:response regulator transcription factor [Candidatus Riflebacteria bacterium]